LLIAESVDPQASLGQHFTSFSVILSLRQVNITIQLDNQVSGMAVEIYDKAADNLLTAEVKSS